MMRVSDWQIVWDPASAWPRTLLAVDDILDGEIRLPLSQMGDVGRPDFSAGGLPVARGNRKRRLEFTRIDSHASVDEAWAAVFASLADDPWGLKGTLSITPRGGVAVLFTAAILSSTHRVSPDGGPVETLHSYSFRIVPQA